MSASDKTQLNIKKGKVVGPILIPQIADVTA